MMPTWDKDKTWPAVGLFLAFTAVLSGVVDAVIAGFGLRPYVAWLMWTPGIAAIMTCKMLGISVRGLGFRWPQTRFILLSVAIPFFYGLAAYAILWGGDMAGAINPKFIDHAHSYLKIPRDWSEEATLVFAVVATSTTWIMWHIPTALGEELGWRGFLTPALYERFGFTGASLMTGAVWGVWHLPIILMTDYGGTGGDVLQILYFMVLMLGLSVIMTWLRLVSQSMWPAVFLHGSHNLFILETFERMSIKYDDTAQYAGEFGLVLPLVVAAFAGVVWWRVKARGLTAPALAAQT